jgi:uncharacterized membrane protein YfcA
LTPNLISEVLATPGLLLLVLTIAAAGIVRGFSGFGTALIFVPIGNIFLPTVQVITLITLTGIGSSVALLPRALRVAQLREVATLGVAAAVTVPLGLWIVKQLDQDMIRWIAALIAFGMLAALVAGWRYLGKIDTKRLIAIGLAAGVMGGMTGLTGPAVILFYLASGSGASIVRANTIVFLAILDVVIVVNIALGGMVTAQILGIALVLTVPYFITTKIGQAMFAPEYETTYRWMAYTVIALAVLTGLPIWSGTN